MIKLPNLPKLLIVLTAGVLGLTLAAGGTYFLLHKNAEATAESSAVQEPKAEKEPTTETKLEASAHEEESDASPEESPSQSHSLKKSHHHQTFPNVLIPKKDFLTLIVMDLGLNQEFTELAITELPPEVVLSFSPYAKLLNRWFHPAKEAGHQLLIQLHNENDLFGINIITYFDGVMLTAVDEPVKEKKILEDFIVEAKNKGLLIIDDRLLFDNQLQRYAQSIRCPLLTVDHSVNAKIIIDDGIDLLSLKGIVAVDVHLVPHLIDVLGKNPDAKLKKLEVK